MSFQNTKLRQNSQPLTGEDLAFALAEIDHPVARSLLRAWSSDRGWTARQAAYAARLVREAAPVEGEERLVPPAPYLSGGAWWRDVSAARQALRGVKSGIMRRWRTRKRDNEIKALYEAGQHTQTMLAELFALSVRTIKRILRRFREGVDIRRRTVAPTDSLLAKIRGSMKGTRTLRPSEVGDKAGDERWMDEWDLQGDHDQWDKTPIKYASRSTMESRYDRRTADDCGVAGED